MRKAMASKGSQEERESGRRVKERVGSVCEREAQITTCVRRRTYNVL